LVGLGGREPVAEGDGEGVDDGLLGALGGDLVTPKPSIDISTPLLRVTAGT
jgi:hypothetical protein